MQMKPVLLTGFAFCGALTITSLFAQQNPASAPAPPAQVSRWKLALETDPADLK